MSWDIFIQDLPNVRSMSEVPADHVPAPIGAQGKPGDTLFVEVSADPLNPYVQQQVRYTVKLYFAVNLGDGSLDEPTAALDARAEHEVFLRFAELMKGKAAVLISHRFSTVRMADRILFLEHGQLLELGSHEELLAKGGKYAELFRLQAKGYL